jgi:prophage antirepressor-like protein
MPKNNLQEPGMAKFYSARFGFLHACRKDGRIWFNLTDVCRCLGLSLKLAEGWMSECKCPIKEYNVKRAKVTTCNRYVENDGLSTILILCCRAIANDYRRWIVSTVLYSILNPEHSLAIKELDDETCNKLTAQQITDKYISRARERVPSPQEDTQQIGKAVPLTPKTPAPVAQTQLKHEAIVSKPFKPTNGHLLIEDWFRQEFPIAEFLGYIDGMLADVGKFVKKLPKKDRWPVQHRLNVMTVFRKVLKANEGNIRYSPTPERAACTQIK